MMETSLQDTTRDKPGQQDSRNLKENLSPITNEEFDFLKVM